MFTTSSNIKRSFYCQTGNFQFGCSLSLSNYTGTVNFGLSGSGVNNLNFLLSGGKIIDPTSKFVGSYPANSQFSVSGNLTSGLYDVLINGYPSSYGNSKSTGIYNYFYINPANLNCSYNFYVNGKPPGVYATNVNCYSGDSVASGLIVNTGGLPLKIYSGQFTNFSSFTPFSISGIFTGDLYNTGKFYILPQGIASVGQYTGNLQLTTNAGILSYSVTVNISGSGNLLTNALALNGPPAVTNNGTQLYTASVSSNSGSGVGVLISLAHITGSGNYFTNVPTLTGFSGRITGFISNSGILVSSTVFTGIGTGQGGQFNTFGTGFASGYITGSGQFATGFFTWPIDLLVSGFGTGAHYSGVGTGIYHYIVGATILPGSGTYTLSGKVTATSGTIQSIKPTGYIHGTGKIFYNIPKTNDKLYINDPNTAIVHGFTEVGLSNLTSYINNHTGIHKVTAINDGANVITLSGIYGMVTNVNLWVDSTNKGTMSVSGPQLSGGLDLGLATQIITKGNLTGQINSIFVGSGFYSQYSSGYLYGSGNVLDYTKTFTGVWNLFTGRPLFPIDYRGGNFFNSNKSVYQNNLPVYLKNVTDYITVSYSNPYDNGPDVVLLTATGVNLVNVSQTILITGQN